MLNNQTQFQVGVKLILILQKKLVFITNIINIYSCKFKLFSSGWEEIVIFKFMSPQISKYNSFHNKSFIYIGEDL